MLLHGKSLTIERPARGTGMAVGVALSGFTLVVAVALLARALDWPASFPQFLAYAGAALMAGLGLVFAFWTYACATLEYVASAGDLSIRWGPIVHRIPLSAITSITQGRGEQRPRIAGVGWMGYHVGRGEVNGMGRVLFFSTHRVPEEIVYVRTADVTYALSPQDPARFVAGIERARKAAGTGGGEPLVEREIIAAHPIWSDRLAQWLVLAAVLMNAALWGYLLASYPDLSNEITIEFPPIGDITTLESRDEILKVPATASALLGVNIFAALLFHPKERAATYLLLSGSVFFQAVFWVAAVVAVLNA